MSLSKQDNHSKCEEVLAGETNAVDLNHSDTFPPIRKPSQQETEDTKKLDITSISRLASEEKLHIQSPNRLVQNCSTDCMMSQKIVDKLLSRMMRLENERSELLAANRSWAVQYDLMKERYLGQIESLKGEVKYLKRDKKERLRESTGERQERNSTSSNVQDQLSALTHQAEVYKEDFLEERKARARAHSKLEEARIELRREKKTRARLAAMLQQQTQPVTCEKSTPVVG